MDIPLGPEVKTLNDAVSYRMRGALAGYRYVHKDVAAAIGLTPKVFSTRCQGHTDWKLDELLAVEKFTEGRITIAGLLGLTPMPPFRPANTGRASSTRKVVG